MKILVTGFKPFLGAEINPSEVIARKISQNFSEVEALILPVEFGNSFVKLSTHLAENAYDYLIMLGQAAGRSKIGFEKIGLNWIQTEHRDELGVLPLTGKILKNEPLALMSTVAIDELYMVLKRENHDVEISFSAGSFVCNDLYFRVLHKYPDLPAVFVHVPIVKDMNIIQQQSTIARIFDLIIMEGNADC